MPSTSLASVLAGTGSIGLFASRAFVSAFAIAALLRWGPQIDAINNLGLLQQITDVPTWFTHDLTLLILGILAAIEIAANKSADARQLMIEIDGYLKSSTAFVTTLTTSGIISQTDAEVIRQITAGIEPATAGLGDSALSIAVALFSALGVYITCFMRRSWLGAIMEADPGDDTMIGGLVSWAEDVWALFGTLLLILFPLVMLGLTVVLLGFLALMHRRAMRREQQSKRPCASCGEPMYASAMACPHCKVENATVCGIDWLGRSLQTPAPDSQGHPIRLMQKQRCPVCATHLKPRRTDQACEACGHEPFADRAGVEAYLRALDARVPMVLVVTGLLSLIPIVGLIPAIIVYRIRLVSPVRRYTSMLGTIPTRWALRLLFLILVWVQVLPGIGAFAVPAMALISYSVYRKLFTRQIARHAG